MGKRSPNAEHYSPGCHKSNQGRRVVPPHSAKSLRLAKAQQEALFAIQKERDEDIAKVTAAHDEELCMVRQDLNNKCRQAWDRYNRGNTKPARNCGGLFQKPECSCGLPRWNVNWLNYTMSWKILDMEKSKEARIEAIQRDYEERLEKHEKAYRKFKQEGGLG
ncbi:hypothetical protein EsH8_IX_000415 [Colletotrichum jinshuiense]